ncbi:cathepsin F-like [Scyliorhinus canicula]|uniref:cathepsin F-like n=1 Tax=Scyliorhinus canicula TaxID=7830 RepID=UPI0018F4CC2B|nr:cathepsin F-like [Scyliorhinus canicula]
MESFYARCLLVTSVLLPLQAYPPREQGRAQALNEEELAAMFRDFVKTYSKVYQSQEEETHRFKIFVESVERARKFQEEETGTAKYGVTKFSDLSEGEMKSDARLTDPSPKCGTVQIRSDNKDLPNSKDWRKDQSVTNVKDQGSHCKACWAFAVVANVESQWAIKSKVLASLSTQEVLDCSKAGNCSGGFVGQALRSIVHDGLMDEDMYKYTQRAGVCHRVENEIAVRIKSCISLKADEEGMKQYVAVNGTITTLVNLKGLLAYQGGILRSNCPSTPTNHAVLIVGYGVGM